MPSGGSRRLFAGTAFAVIALDLVTKFLAENTLSRVAAIPVIGEWVQLRLVYNPGAAFGLHLGPYSRWIFLAVAAIAVVVLTRMARAAAPGEVLRQLSLGLVAGGAFGNLVDRIRSGRGVVDFIDVGVGSLRWPTFNVADIGVSCGAVLLAISLWREDARQQAQAEAASR
ncbi:MAG: signal peptidase II [Gemmatimonadota bacterium]